MNVESRATITGGETSMNNDIECVFDGICELGECPVWNVDEQRLYWTDITGKRLWVFDPRRRRSRLFRESDVRVGGFAFTVAGDLVLCAEQSVYLLERRGVEGRAAKPRKLFDVPMKSGELFNDITVDPRGRILAGTLTEGRPDGTLFRIEPGREPAVLLENVHCSNGMTFSLDEKTFFHTNTGKHRVTQYDYDLDTGAIANPGVFFQGTEVQGLPDGLTLDAEGCVWQAFWGAGLVRRFNPDGAIVEEIPVPAKQPSSVMFGGADLGDLYITTAAKGADDPTTGTDADGAFRGGRVYRYRSGVRGRPEWLVNWDTNGRMA